MVFDSSNVCFWRRNGSFLVFAGQVEYHYMVYAVPLCSVYTDGNVFRASVYESNHFQSLFTSTVAPRFVAFGTLCVVSGTKENRSSGRLTRKEVRNVLSILGKTIYSHTVAVSKRVSLFIHYGYLGSRYKLCVSVSGFVSFGFKVWISQRMEFSRITSDLFFLTIHIRNRFNIYT